ncbi:MAG: glycoside hydrolase family 16 protein [Clostridia bacterium]|nr:glycoside hydrolase family 16 protein [Clostridia bacterium]
MNLKKLLSLAISFTILLCCTACDKGSIVSDYTSTITEIYEEETEIIDNTSSNDSTPQSTITSTPSVESVIPDIPQEVPEEETESNETGYEFYFDHIESVDYFCVKNIPNSDIVYAITDIIADTKDNIAIGCKLFCDDSNVKISNKTVTIPYSYKQQNKIVTVTVRYSLTGQSKNFTLQYYDDWPMVWEDEFDGNSIDFTKWDFRPDWLRDKGYVNYWDKSTMFVDGNGNLVSRATPGKKTVWDKDSKSYKEIDAYLSGAISTKGLFESTYGYYETRVKLHHQTGMWGAFWLICGDMDTDAPADKSSVNGCELDVFESLFNYGGVTQNIHWDGFMGNTVSLKSNGYVTYIDTYDNDYHTFALSWTPNEFVFLVDGIVTRRTTAAGVCDQPGYMIISTECGTWAGKWVLGEGEYSDMLVDYVRVYQSPTNTYK